MVKQFITRRLYPRVERWVYNLPLDYVTGDSIKVSLSLLGILGLPTSYSEEAHRRANIQEVEVAILNEDIEVAVQRRNRAADRAEEYRNMGRVL